MAQHFLYLTTIGRTSGAERQIEIWFVERESAYYIVAETGDGAGWVKNLKKQPRVVFSVGTRSTPGDGCPATRATARVVRDADDPGLVGAVKALMDAKYGWSDGLVVELRREPELQRR
jgi:deazaflavin-dependent oxidoreductase (nitroreductase family)